MGASGTVMCRCSRSMARRAGGKRPRRCSVSFVCMELMSPLCVTHSHMITIHTHIPAEMRRAGVEPTFSHYYEAMRAAAFAGQKEAALELLEEAEAATGEKVRCDVCRLFCFYCLRS
jgi:hypothetical protein